METNNPNKKNFNIRNATLEDLPQVIKINEEALPENYPEYFFVFHLENWGKAFFVAEVDGKIVGYIMNRIETGIGYIRKLIVKKGHVVSIAVLEGYRRMGIGEELMRRGMASMRDEYGAKEVYLEVRVSNEPAIRLYEKLGFKKIKVIEGYYSDGENAYVMAAPI
ncbi:MAG: ribosomal protein S18-alanine N-acetyltransferase [Fervidicoccaceae archaeon]|uniref:N-alpha-acetyltransferase n=1 Tax=Fervidicoccus fontis TaxID=683846 RepID=A0A7C2YJF5_9CREN|nr:MAG: ribosomal-protein-alanine N-acetyltransferase [Fervidicoccus fontis]HEU97571.1 ribosomal-protein-alanine N-acetyltransferase [Fervidicoccus fontis]